MDSWYHFLQLANTQTNQWSVAATRTVQAATPGCQRWPVAMSLWTSSISWMSGDTYHFLRVEWDQKKDWTPKQWKLSNENYQKKNGPVIWVFLVEYLPPKTKNKTYQPALKSQGAEDDHFLRVNDHGRWFNQKPPEHLRIVWVFQRTKIPNGRLSQVKTWLHLGIIKLSCCLSRYSDAILNVFCQPLGCSNFFVVAVSQNYYIGKCHGFFNV